METFYEFFIRKYPTRLHIYNNLKEFNDKNEVLWETLTDDFFDRFADWLLRKVSSGSAGQYFSVIKALLDKARNAGKELKTHHYREILKAKQNKVCKTYLNIDDLKSFEQFKPRNDIEYSVWALTLVGAYTGARHSDFIRLNKNNIQDNQLVYISEKTNIKSTVPIKPLIKKIILSGGVREISLTTFIDTLRKICIRCQINQVVTVFKKGEEMTGPKWKFISSHTARASFATNLYLLGCDLFSISKMMGHSNIDQTMRYIVCDKIELNNNVMKYFV